jgi:hypothetical protein
MILGIWAGLFWVQMKKTVQVQRAGPLGPNLALQASSLAGGWDFAAGLKLVCNWLVADLFPGPFH